MNVPATRHPRKIGTYCDIDTRRYMGTGDYRSSGFLKCFFKCFRSKPEDL